MVDLRACQYVFVAGRLVPDVGRLIGFRGGQVNVPTRANPSGSPIYDWSVVDDRRRPDIDAGTSQISYRDGPGGRERAAGAMTDDNAPATSSSGWKRLVPLALLAGAAVAAWASGLTDYLSLQSIAENRDALMARVEENRVVALLVFAALYIAVIALSLPGGVLLTILGGFLFGWLIGGLVTVVAATVGATAIFLIARTALGETLAAKAGPWLDRVRKGIEEDGLSYLLFLRLVPAFPFWLVNLAPALLGMRLGPYILGTFLGIIPGTFAFAFAGAGLDSIISAQREAYEDCMASGGGADQEPCAFTLDAGSLLTPEILIAFVALGIVALVPVVLKRFRASKG